MVKVLVLIWLVPAAFFWLALSEYEDLLKEADAQEAKEALAEIERLEARAAKEL